MRGLALHLLLMINFVVQRVRQHLGPSCLGLPTQEPFWVHVCSAWFTVTVGIAAGAANSTPFLQAHASHGVNISLAGTVHQARNGSITNTRSTVPEWCICL